MARCFRHRMGERRSVTAASRSNPETGRRTPAVFVPGYRSRIRRGGRASVFEVSRESNSEKSTAAFDDRVLRKSRAVADEPRKAGPTTPREVKTGFGGTFASEWWKGGRPANGPV